MKKNLRLTIMLAACGLIFAGASAASAQTDEPVAGGYSRTPVTGKSVVAAAKAAVRAQAKKQRATIRLVSINEAARQVVAGTNYQLCLKVEITERGKKTKTAKIVQAVVFQNLKQKLILTEWAEAECGKK
jgi:hypothetical protein